MASELFMAQGHTHYGGLARGPHYSAVGIATRYVLDALWFETQWEREIFSPPHASRPAPGPTFEN
jgi:hypothetical protein